MVRFLLLVVRVKTVRLIIISSSAVRRINLRPIENLFPFRSFFVPTQILRHRLDLHGSPNVLLLSVDVTGPLRGFDEILSGHVIEEPPGADFTNFFRFRDVRERVVLLDGVS